MSSGVVEVTDTISYVEASRRALDEAMAADPDVVLFGEDAADALAGEGIDVEVVDLRTVAPLARATVCESDHRRRRRGLPGQDAARRDQLRRTQDP